jgi:hypothetical protein
MYPNINRFTINPLLTKIKSALMVFHSKFAGKQVITDADKVSTLERAKAFRTCNPSFVLVMGASYVEHHFLLVSCKKTLGRLSSFIGFHNFHSFHFLSIKPNGS